MKSLFINYKQSSIHYLRIGSGKELLFAFHGYGENAGSFLLLEELIGKDYTIVAIDFPFHGQTNWNEDLLFTVEDLINIINLITQLPNQSFHLMGFSMGGRVAFQVLQSFPDKIKKIILIAPDGLHNNIWHSISTQTKLGNLIFAYAMKYPGLIFGLMKIGVKLNLFNKSIFNFVHYYLDDADSRLTLYKRWTTMRKFNPDKSLLKLVIAQKKISIKMLFGKFDNVIITKRGEQFKKGIEQFVEVKEINAGHQLLKEKYATEIAALFRS
jgi:pimeloyl-ACP methyl ester carboxylesterase